MSGRRTLVAVCGAFALLAGWQAAPATAVYTNTLTGGGIQLFGDSASDLLLVDSEGPLLRHNRFASGDPGYNSSLDWAPAAAPGDQTVGGSTTVVFTITAGAGDDVVVLQPPPDDYGSSSVDPGTGADVVTTGSGTDQIAVADGTADSVSCGPGADSVTADAADSVSSDCENVTRPPTPAPPAKAKKCKRKGKGKSAASAAKKKACKKKGKK